MAIGSPFGLGYTVTSGVLSAKGRGGLGMNQIEDYLQTDAGINPGNSGGPLCDLSANVLGINTMIVGRGAGIGFAVPASLVKRVADQLVKSGRVERAWIGAGVQDLTPELAAVLKVDPPAGALVHTVHDGGPSQKANVKAGDVITAVGGKKITDTRELVREVISREIGQPVTLEIHRDGKRYGTTVNLVARSEAAVPALPVQQAGVPESGLGLKVRDLPAQQGSANGFPNKVLPVVTHIDPGSTADRSGLRLGDVIVEADGVEAPSSSQLAELAKDGQLLVRVRRREQAFYAALKK